MVWISERNNDTDLWVLALSLSLCTATITIRTLLEDTEQADVSKCTKPHKEYTVTLMAASPHVTLMAASPP